MLEERLVHRANRGSDMLTVRRPCDVHTTEHPANAVTGAISPLFLSPPSLRLDARRAIQRQELLVRHVALEVAQHAPQRRLPPLDTFRETAAIEESVPVVERERGVHFKMGQGPRAKGQGSGPRDRAPLPSPPPLALGPWPLTRLSRWLLRRVVS